MKLKLFALTISLLSSTVCAQPINQALSTREKPRLEDLETAIRIDKNPTYLNHHADNYLHVAAKRNFCEGIHRLMKITLLSDRYLDTNDKGRTAIEITIRGDCLDAFEALLVYLKSDDNILIKSQYNGSLLHLAARLGRSDMIKPLIDSGVLVNSKDNRGWSPLDVAREARTQDLDRNRENHYQGTISALIKHGGKSTKGEGKNLLNWADSEDDQEGSTEEERSVHEAKLNDNQLEPAGYGSSGVCDAKTVLSLCTLVGGFAFAVCCSVDSFF